MKLLFLWVNDKGRFKDFSLNFDSAYRFSLLHNGQSYELKCSMTGDAIPEGFFNVGDSRCVDDVSVVVGKNASGKTSVARFIQGIRANEDATAKFDYVLVYEIDCIWRVQWYVERNVNDTAPASLSLPPKPYGVKDIIPCKGGSDCRRNKALWDFEFAYYSPHFTTENPFPLNSPEMDNLSTNGIMYGGFEEQMSRPYTIHDHPGIQKNYLAVEHRMGLTFIRKMSDFARRLNIPAPKGVKIAIHTVEFEENHRWLDIQKKRLLARLEDQNKRQNVGEDWIRKKLLQIEKLHDAYRWCDEFSEKKFYFVARAFVALMFSYVRISGFFEERYNPLYVDYAEWLIHVYDEAVLPHGCESPNSDASIFYNELCDCLKRGIRLRGAVPGNIAEECYPECLNERRATVRLFAQMRDWCLDMRPAEHQEMLSHIIVNAEHGEQLGGFLDDYTEAMKRFDFLEFSYEPVLSSGEMSFLSMFARLYDFLDRMNESRNMLGQKREQNYSHNEIPTRLMRRSFSPQTLVFLDEAETTLHPEWQRRIVLFAIKFFNALTFNNSTHLVFATHSPMILSDVPKGNVSFLDESGQVPLPLQNTFGGNVYDLYRLGFFMENGAVGAFAVDKIKAAMEQSGVDTEKGDCEFVINHVGDGLVRTYLKRKSRNCFRSHDSSFTEEY